MPAISPYGWILPGGALQSDGQAMVSRSRRRVDRQPSVVTMMRTYVEEAVGHQAELRGIEELEILAIRRTASPHGSPVKGMTCIGSSAALLMLERQVWVGNAAAIRPVTSHDAPEGCRARTIAPTIVHPWLVTCTCATASSNQR